MHADASIFLRIWFPRLKLKSDEPFSNFAYNFNLCHYKWGYYGGYKGYKGYGGYHKPYSYYYPYYYPWAYNVFKATQQYCNNNNGGAEQLVVIPNPSTSIKLGFQW